jgi:hypothetical protein
MDSIPPNWTGTYHAASGTERYINGVRVSEQQWDNRRDGVLAAEIERSRRVKAERTWEQRYNQNCRRHSAAFYHPPRAPEPARTSSDNTVYVQFAPQHASLCSFDPAGFKLRNGAPIPADPNREVLTAQISGGDRQEQINKLAKQGYILVAP